MNYSEALDQLIKKRLEIEIYLYNEFRFHFKMSESTFEEYTGIMFTMIKNTNMSLYRTTGVYGYERSKYEEQ